MNIRKRKLVLVTVCICSVLFSATVFAGTMASEGWNVYNSSRTVYANVGVGFSSDTFPSRALITYTARVLGEDAYAVTSNNPARIHIYGDASGEVDKNFWFDNPASGSTYISSKNTQVAVEVQIDGVSNIRIIYKD